MIDRNYYMKHVLPQLDIPMTEKYPSIRLDETDGYHPLGDHAVLMLVALTGTGKTTTLNALVKQAGDDLSNATRLIPSRREVADWITIPTAQHILGEPIVPVDDRVQRFHYTRTFAEHVPGGQATSFSWINVVDAYTGMIVSEGIRGDNELHYALSTYSNWHVVELALDPITRLKRLSSRNSVFDKVAEAGDVSFLPDEMHDEAKRLLQSGDITGKALTIMQAEAESYGLFPFVDGDKYANYHRVDADDLTPEQVAEQVYGIIKDTIYADN